jgi:hypothetical protein
MYCIYLGKAVQTVNPPNSSVGSSQVSADLITGQTALGATPADTDELLISDAGTLKRVDYSYLKSSNTPAFQAYLSADQSYSSGYTKVQFDTERFDTDNAYDNSTNYRFTVPSGEGGKYFISAQVMGFSTNEAGLSYNFVSIYKNGSQFNTTSQDWRSGRIHNGAVVNSDIMDLSAGDYLEVYVLLSGTGTVRIEHDNGNVTGNTRFFGYKLLT